MVKEHRYLNYTDFLQMEYHQCLDEGKDVRGLQEKITIILAMDQENPAREMQAVKLLKETLKLPIKKDYPYEEPSDLPEIKRLRPKGYRVRPFGEKREDLYDRIYGAWLGRCAGCLLGQPIEGFKRERIIGLLNDTDNYPISGYISSDIDQKLIDKYEIHPGGMPKKEGLMKNWINNVDCMPEDDDTNYTILALKLLENHGRNFTPDDVGHVWLMNLPIIHLSSAERIAYKNMVNRIYPPDSAVFLNIYREWIGAQIRADFFGYINPGKPEAAAEMAWRDASISHVKNGIYGEMFVAAMLAHAAVSENIEEITKVGLSEIPAECRLSAEITRVLNWYSEGSLNGQTAMEKVLTEYDEELKYHWAHTIPNAMLVCIALLWGNKNFDSTMFLAVSCGFDTDCNGATAGSILGMILGAGAIPEKWTQPLNDRIISAVNGYEISRISELASRTLDYL
jgi:ADP-ribosylglycohydrolase